MSEFAAEHADARLLGTPLGYVGYDASGELTNAVRARPFSVITGTLRSTGGRAMAQSGASTANRWAIAAAGALSHHT